MPKEFLSLVVHCRTVNLGTGNFYYKQKQLDFVEFFIFGGKRGEIEYLLTLAEMPELREIESDYNRLIDRKFERLCEGIPL